MKRNRLSYRKAVIAKCRDCIYDPAAGGTWLAQVACCSSASCPLWPVRPAPKGAGVPRDPATVSQEWLRRGHAKAIAALRSDTHHIAGFDAKKGTSGGERSGEISDQGVGASAAGSTQRAAQNTWAAQ